MAKSPDKTAAPPTAPDEPRPGLFARLFAGPRWLARHPIKGGLVILIAVAVIGCATWIALSVGRGNQQTAAELMKSALDHFEAGEEKEARQAAALLQTRPDLTPVEKATAYFVLGMSIANEADRHPNAAQQKMLHLIAARYLQESQLRGFLPGREADGLLRLAISLHAAGRFDECLPVLRELQASKAGGVTRLDRLFADCYSQISPPDALQTLKHVRAYLTYQHLAEADRHWALLLESRTLLDLGDLAAADQAASAIAPQSSDHSAAVVLRSLVLAKQAEQWLATQLEPAPLPDATRTALTESIATLQVLQAQKNVDSRIAAEAQILIGTCHQLLGDDRAAIGQFDRIGRLGFGREEGLAAAVFEAELAQKAGDAEKAVKLYQRALSQAGPRETYHNHWLPLQALEVQLVHATEAFIAQQQFHQAVSLAEALRELFPEAISLELMISAERAWANQLLQPADKPPLEQEVARAEARQHFRLAGVHAERLARLRIATRHFEDDLVMAAESYRQGHAYRQAARVYREFLAQGPQTGQPEALIGLGESLMAEGDNAAAIAVFDQCRQDFPIHPATYTARRMESLAYIEIGKLAEAKELLLDNLYRFSLTPQSDDWRDSLFAMGQLQFRAATDLETQGRLKLGDQASPADRQQGLKLLEECHAAYQDAADTLTEAVQRYPQAPQAFQASYQIGEAHRRSAIWPRKKLDAVNIETSRLALKRQMQGELEMALAEYNRLLSELASQERGLQRSATELAILRNCYFSKADALFDLGRYEEAIAAYSAATNRYQQEPEALEAYVQIAHCYRQLNRHAEARGTIEQARVVLQRIRPDANFTRTTRLDRNQWTELLGWLRTL